MDSKKPKPESFADATKEMPEDIADAVQKSTNQARSTFENTSELAQSNMSALDSAAGALRACSLDLQRKTIEMAQTNINAGFDYFRRALALKHPADFLALNQEFVRDQLAAFSSQASELSGLSLRLAKEASEPVQKGLRRTLGDLSSRIAA